MSNQDYFDTVEFIRKVLEYGCENVKSKRLRHNEVIIPFAWFSFSSEISRRMYKSHRNVCVLQASRHLLGTVIEELGVQLAVVRESSSSAFARKQFSDGKHIKFKLISPSRNFVSSLLASLASNLRVGDSRGDTVRHITEFLESSNWKPLLKGCTTEAIFSTAHLILSSLLCAIDEMMEVIDPARRPSPPQRRTNVSSLPEEILTQIFHEAFPATVSADQNDWDKKRARIRRLLRLTRVNTRFHHIIHSTISFWTYLYESMGQRESRFTLQKLRAAGPSIEITVELFIPEAETNLRGTDFLNCVRPFISQWKRLILVLPPVNVDRTCEWILKNITKENCPKLRTIELFSGCRSGAPVLDLSSLRTTIQNVRTFRVSGLTPCFHCAFSFTTLSLTFTSSKQFEQIFTAIKPVCSTLETFEITLNSNRLLTGDSDPGFEEELRRQADEVAFSHPSQAIKFTRLRELTLVLIGPSYILSGEKFQDVLETLLSNNPLLETVTIEIQGEYGGTADSFLRVLVTWINQQHSLRELYFDACRVVPNSQLFRGASSYESVLPLLASHPNLSKLVLSGDAFGKPLRVMDLEPLPDSFVVNCPLQTLILTGFSTFDGLPLLRGIRQGANWALFQRLDIRGASCFAHTSDITAIIPEQLLRTDEYIPGSHGGWKHVPKGARNSEKFVLGTLDSDSTADVEYELRTTSSWVGMVRSQDTDENYASNF